MQAILITVIVWVLGSAVARILVGAGLAFGTYNVVSDLIQSALDYIDATVNGLGTASTFLVMMGISEWISIVGSALLTYAAFASAKVFLMRNG